ncbi:hypothetical protein CUZ56_01423 [Saezia sanguinis]|uniref:Uncharacterized protein n=2 Tax=Saezia sanguinis TaxID=1965230 RepID=A0A433SFK2_9BURK|nr:hypothetical protein CUZ56_01423 [Saezia sanguinis]
MLSVVQVRDLIDKFPFPKWVKEEMHILLHQGDAHIDGHLHLDWDRNTLYEQWLQSNAASQNIRLNDIDGIVITADLHVTESILNTNADGGPFLIVMGNCRARNIVSGGASIIIKKDASISDAVYGFYNHGELDIWGRLITTILINEDHAISIGLNTFIQTGKFSPEDVAYQIKITESIDNSARIPARLKPLLSPRIQLWGDILPALRNGQRVIATTDEKKPDSVEDWVALVWKNPAVLKKVPKQLKTTEAFYLSLFAENSPLDRMLISELVGQIPQNACTEKVMVAAMQLSPKSLLRVPLAVDLHALYEQCFMQVRHPQKIFEDIPEQFRSAAMQKYLQTLDQ